MKIINDRRQSMKARSLLFPILSLAAGLITAIIAINTTSNWQPAYAFADQFTLTILHTNDIHSHYAPFNNDGSACKDGDVCLGGSARLKTKIDEIRAAETNTILVDAGDQFQGTLYYKLFKAEIVTKTMNLLGYEAMAIGNHEFDDGPEMLAKLVDGVGFPVLGTNLDVSAEASLTGKLPLTTVITVGGEKIGLLGLTTPDTSFLSKPGPTVIFRDPKTCAESAVKSLQNQGVDKIIALTHLGYDDDIELAQSINGIDVIVGGHSHTFIYTPTVPITFTPPIFPKYAPITPLGQYPTLVNTPNGDPALVITEYCWDVFIGLMKVTFNGDGKIVGFQGNPIYLSNDIAKDPTVTAMMVPYDEKVRQMYATIVGTTTVPLPVQEGNEEICRTGECLLGDLVNDAILWKLNSDSSNIHSLGASDVITPYHIAILNGGVLRAPLDESISVGDILDVLPFGNTVATFEITGSYLISALEIGLSKYGASSGTGRFPQVAGLRYSFNPNMPIGSRLINVELKTETGFLPLNPLLIYRVATNDYVRTGGDGYTIFKDYAIHPYDYGPALDETVQDYIEELGIIHSQDIITGRIHIAYQTILPFIYKNSLP